MFYLLVIFVFNICVLVQSDFKGDDAVIVVPSYISASTCYTEPKPKILIAKKDGTLRITISGNFITKFKKCYNCHKYNPCEKQEHGTDLIGNCKEFEQQPVFTKHGKKNMVYQVSKVTEEMDTMWGCSFEKNTGTDVAINFEMRVNYLEVRINGESLTPNKIEENQMSVDYWYKDGELVDFDCHSNSEGAIRLQYFNKNSTPLIVTDSMKSKDTAVRGNFRKIMTVVNHEDIIDCEYIKETPNITLVQRTVFKVKNDSTERSLNILINDELLHPIQNTNEHNKSSKYSYKYFEGEVLKVTCSKDQSIFGNLNLHSTNEDIESNIHKEIEKLWIKTIKLNTTPSIDQKQLTCVNSFYSMELRNDLKAVIEFHSDQKELKIIGLPSKNIIDEYNKNETTRIIDYHYTVDETIKLECVARKNKELLWIFENVETEEQEKTIKQAFTLNNTHDGTTIICKTKDDEDKIQQIIVQLHKTRRDSESASNIQNDELFNLDDMIIPAACVLLIVVIGGMVACYVSWSKRTRILNIEQNPYANLQEPDAPIPPYPNQWSNKLQNSEGHMIENTLYDSKNTTLYAVTQKNKLPKNIIAKNNKPILKCNDKTEIINNTPNYTNGKGNDDESNYHYIETNITVNLKDNKMNDLRGNPIPTCSNMKVNDGETIYVEPYARSVHANSETSINQEHLSDSKEGEYDYVYADRYGNKMACGVNIGGQIF